MQRQYFAVPMDSTLEAVGLPRVLIQSLTWFAVIISCLGVY